MKHQSILSNIFFLLLLTTTTIIYVHGACQFPALETDTEVACGTTCINTGATVIAGSVSVYPGNTISGFAPNGGGVTVPTAQNYNLANTAAIMAQSDATTLYNIAFNSPCTTIFNSTTSVDLGGMTLTPGTYCFTIPVTITGQLTLNGQANSSTSVFIFQMSSTLSVSSGAVVVAINGTNACNVLWATAKTAQLGTSSVFLGKLVANNAITLNPLASTTGILYSRSSFVSLDSNVVQQSLSTTFNTTLVCNTAVQNTSFIQNTTVNSINMFTVLQFICQTCNVTTNGATTGVNNQCGYAQYSYNTTNNCYVSFTNLTTLATYSLPVGQVVTYYSYVCTTCNTSNTILTPINSTTTCVYVTYNVTTACSTTSNDPVFTYAQLTGKLVSNITTITSCTNCTITNTLTGVTQTQNCSDAVTTQTLTISICHGQTFVANPFRIDTVYIPTNSSLCKEFCASWLTTTSAIFRCFTRADETGFSMVWVIIALGALMIAGAWYYYNYYKVAAATTTTTNNNNEIGFPRRTRRY